MSEQCVCQHYVVDYSDPERYHPENVDRELNPECPEHNPEATGYAIWAVAQWLEAHDAGEPYEIYRNADGTGGGYRLTVERLPTAPMG